ncbi:unnamed protein product [Durusdinium trenchii]|uniref:Uncharacterized protein n=1 Tax=Durusdinium trenchii TaxID=1381693 RepID=A0ABP0HDD2_9DINO
MNGTEKDRPDKLLCLQSEGSAMISGVLAQDLVANDVLFRYCRKNPLAIHCFQDNYQKLPATAGHFQFLPPSIPLVPLLENICNDMADANDNGAITCSPFNAFLEEVDHAVHVFLSLLNEIDLNAKA